MASGRLWLENGLAFGNINQISAVAEALYRFTFFFLSCSQYILPRHR